MGDDGSREGEHDVGGNSGEQVTSSSRLRAREMIDGRQSGASQTETSDGLERLKDAKEANDYPQADNRGILMTPVAPRTISAACINYTKECYATLRWRVIRGGLCIRGACDGCRLSPESSRWTRAGLMRRLRLTNLRSMRARAGRTRADESACFLIVMCCELQPERWFSQGKLREPCPGRSSMRQRRVEAVFAG
ncbi:hypothetical protein LMG28140_05516 [Paraburkholderia metrosideri]|uniref:Uncharacterized protein n=1 Tax=Paraburkholderia metrosideri TaxID=580937 RepID=A0ABN7I6E4_9BURK|nr:hypothetical protein LMG28140_05516 [Paraburkholderia metrosideri]